ncbi:MAG: pyridoxal-phosphate dependent enzyme [Chloroflexia bacterium]|nr:pyridoxal-phosphate dependent enzyme [Chloroflexia bacterium]
MIDYPRDESLGSGSRCPQTQSSLPGVDPVTVPAATTNVDRASIAGDPWTGSLPTLVDVYRARSAIRAFLPPTPLLRSPALSERLGFDLVVKCETLQPTGAFKVRGGLYLLSRLPEARRRRGVVAASTGNHGQSIAYAAGRFGVKATIFLPERANALKVEALRRLGAEIIHSGDDFDACFAEAERYAERTGAHFIHSANEPDLIAGVATHTLEIMEAEPDVDVVIVPVGGGSGLCGACIAGKGIKPGLTVIGAQAMGAPAVHDSWRARRLTSLDQADTFAEGLATRTAFSLPAAILWGTVDDIVLVSDPEMRRAILTLLETTHMLAEGAGAAGLAAAYQRRESFAGAKVAVIVTGGNLTMDSLQQAMNEEHAW